MLRWVRPFKKLGWDHRKTRLARLARHHQQMGEGILRWKAIPQEAGQRQTSHSPFRGVHPTSGVVRLGGAVRPCGRLQSWEKLQTISADLQQEWYQQDGATPHTAAASHLWLQKRFPGRVISLKEVEWASHSPDLSPLDFFLWGYPKDRVYKDKPRTSEQLKCAIIAEVSAMPSEMVDRAVDHLQTMRLAQVIRRGGAHIEHLLWGAATAERLNANVNVRHRSLCHSIWNTMMIAFLTCHVYSRFYCGKPEYQIFPDTLYVPESRHGWSKAGSDTKVGIPLPTTILQMLTKIVPTAGGHDRSAVDDIRSWNQVSPISKAN